MMRVFRFDRDGETRLCCLVSERRHYRILPFNDLNVRVWRGGKAWRRLEGGVAMMPR